MSTDPLGDALGQAQPGPAAPASGGTASGAAGEGAQQSYSPPQGAGAYQAPSAYEPQEPAAAWPEPEPERSIFERRPEILVGAAAAGGFIAAQVLGRIRGR